MENQSISRITGALVLLFTAFILATVPLTATVLYVLIRERHDGPFFTVYKVGLVIDIIAMLSTQLAGAIPSRGVLISDEFMESHTYLQTWVFMKHFLHTCQESTSMFICLNRATAVLMPVKHHTFWRKRVVFASWFLVLFVVAAALSGAQTRYLETHIEHFSTGERIFANVIRAKQETADNRQAVALLYIGLAAVAMDAVYCIFYYLTFIAHFWSDSRIWFVHFIAVNGAYSCLPSYLLIVFSKEIRKQVFIVFLKLFKRIKGKDAPVIMKVSTGINEFDAIRKTTLALA